MRIAAIQLKACSNSEKIFERAVFNIIKAAKAKAQIIVLPEMFLCPSQGYWDKNNKKDMLLEINRLRKLAREWGVYLLPGSVLERDTTRNPSQKPKYYNTSYLIDDKGKIRAKYRKIHLFNADINGKKIRECDKFLAGKQAKMAVIKNCKIGLSICYDLRFPELYSRYLKKGADMLFVPAAFTYTTGQLHWEILLRARAIENFCYVVAPNLCGKNREGVRLYGNSMIIDPFGKILARAQTLREEILYGHIDCKIIKKARQPFINAC